MKAINSILTVVVATLLPVVGMAQVTERDLTAVFPTQQAEVIWDAATQGTISDSITFDAAGTISTTGSGTDLTLAPADTIILKGANDNQRIITYSASSDTFLAWLYGDSATANQAFAIYSNTSASTDSDSLALSGGGDLTAARGAYLHLKGADASGGGDWTAVAADTVGSDMSFSTSTAAGAISFLAGAATPVLSMTSSSATSLTASFGAAATATQTFSIVSASADAADNDYLCLSGGGSCVAPTRGSYISLYGNETAEAGDLALVTGSASGSAMFLTAGATNGAITFSTNGATALTLSSAQAATFAGAVTSTATGALGWSVVSAANQACTTTCTGAAVFGFDTGTSVIVNDASALSDICVCASAS